MYDVHVVYAVSVAVFSAHLSFYIQFSSSSNNDEISTERIIFDDKHLFSVFFIFKLECDSTELYMWCVYLYRINPMYTYINIFHARTYSDISRRVESCH